MSLSTIALVISIVALLLTFINACTGIITFVLNRVRLLKVRKVDSGFVHDEKGESYYLDVDLLSYGAAIFDLKVKVVIFVEPSRQTIEDHICGTTSMELSPIGVLPNPLNAGKGVRFHARRPIKCMDHNQPFYERAGRALVAAKARNICILITCSDERKILRRLRNRHTLRSIDQYLGSPRKVGWYWWETVISKIRHRRILREAKRFEGAVPSVSTREGKSGRAT